ncbi:MAG: phosphotransferase [Ardenticatenales bacterium]|nr:phosphotransferase [Ardenticatenales bacterium]
MTFPHALPSEIQSFVTQRLSGWQCPAAEQPERWQVFHSNAWVILTETYVFRLGDSIDLTVSREETLWEIGRRCGANTPSLLEAGIFEGKSYMLYRRLPGTPVCLGRLPPVAGRFLRTLHDTEPPPLTRRGNWPSRREHRYEVAQNCMRAYFGAEHPGLWLIQRAWGDFNRAGQVLNHGDFRGSNLLLTEEQQLGVIDWTDAHLGTREEDIGGCEPQDIMALLEGYQAKGGCSLDMELVVGHGLARVASLVQFAVLSSDYLQRALVTLQPLILSIDLLPTHLTR